MKLPKYESSLITPIKEFAPLDMSDPCSAGSVIVRFANYGSGLDMFDRSFTAMQADMATFEPPIELDREDTKVVQYDGECYRGTFGLEVAIPAGHVVPEQYRRVDQLELKR